MTRATFIKSSLFTAAMLIGSYANALAVYSVSSTPTVNCGSSPHGLWTNTYNNSSCNEYFDFQEGSTLTVGAQSAKLSATAMNEAGVVAVIDIVFGGFTDTYAHYKNGGTPNYNGTDTPTDWDFFTFVTSGTISFSNGDDFLSLLVGQFTPGVATTGMPVLQIGDGANDKSAGFGASTWLNIFGVDFNDPAYVGGAHWDLNMSLEPIEGDVPVPGTLLLLGLGLAGLYGSRHRKTQDELFSAASTE